MPGEFVRKAFGKNLKRAPWPVADNDCEARDVYIENALSEFEVNHTAI